QAVSCCRSALVKTIVGARAAICDHLLARTVPCEDRCPVVPRATPTGGWHTGKMPAPRQRPDVSWLPAVAPALARLLEAGQTTKGLYVTTQAGHLIVGRSDEQGADPRFRLAPLGGSTYGLSLYRRQRWEPLRSKEHFRSSPRR